MKTDGQRRLLIRADAGGMLGSGHVMRMIALAQAWQDRGGSVTLLSVTCPQDVAARAQQEGIACERINECQPGDASDLKHTIARAQALGARWGVLDGYHFDFAYQRELRASGFRVLAVDDYGHCDTWAADAVLNQNLFAPDVQYHSENPACRLLLGTRFALLRREFRAEAERGQTRTPRSAGPIRRLLLTLGGVDADNVTGRLLETLDSIPEPPMEIKLLVGAGNAHPAELARQAAASSHQVEVLRDVRDMPALYRWAEGIIGAGGSTCWEWMFYRLPAAVICIADNQRPVVAALAKRRLALDLGWHENFRPENATEPLRAWLGNPLKFVIAPPPGIEVDGLGADRVASLLDDTQVYVRPVRASDARLWFQWANDPAVRANGFYPEPISWETHQQWFDRHRQSPDSRLWVGFDLEERAVGYVRLHRRDNDEWEVGVAVDAAHRGKGMGAKLVHLALQKFSREHRNSRAASDPASPTFTPPVFVANVKPSNAASLKLFQSLGFELAAARSTRECCVFTRLDG